MVLCPRCSQVKLLRDFLRRSNAQNKMCNVCYSAMVSIRSRNRIKQVKADPSMIIAHLNHLDELQAAEAATLGSGYKNVDKWRYHIAKWKRERSKARSTYGLQPKRGVRGHFEYQARHGIIPPDTVEDRIREYYERHPQERPTEGPDSLNSLTGGN